MTSFSMSLKDALLWVYWYPFRGLVQALPVGWLPPLSRAIGQGIAVVARQRRRELTEVMARVPALAKLPNREHWVIRAFQNRLGNELEMLVYPELTPSNIGRFVRWQGKQHLDQGLAKGRGVMLLLSHFGANQMVMPALGYSGYTMCQLSASPLVWKDHITHKRLSRMEEKTLELRWNHELSLPVKHIDVFGSLKGAFSCLKRNEVLGVAMDGAGGKDWVEVDFLGSRALFSTGAMRIAARTGCVVLPTFLVRDDKGVNDMIIAPALQDLTGRDDKESLSDAVQELAHLLERYVIAHPCHYVQFLALRQMTAEKEGEPPLLLSTTSEYSREEDER